MARTQRFPLPLSGAWLLSLAVLSSCQDSVLYNGSVSPEAYPLMQDSRASKNGKPNLNMSQVPETMELKLQDDRALELIFPSDRFDISASQRTQISEIEMRVVLPISQRNAVDRRANVRFLATFTAKIPGSEKTLKRTLNSEKDFTIQFCTVDSTEKPCSSLRKPASTTQPRDILFGDILIEGEKVKVIAEKRNSARTKREADLNAWEHGRLQLAEDVLAEFSGFDASE